jgi:hypothetical protein
MKYGSPCAVHVLHINVDLMVEHYYFTFTTDISVTVEYPLMKILSCEIRRISRFYFIGLCFYLRCLHGYHDVFVDGSDGMEE